MKLTIEYFRQDNVIALAKDLLGKVLYSKVYGEVTAGVIVETEAYFGIKDKASHAYAGRRTARTETMYSLGGVAYVYLCYGMHNLFNVVSGRNDDPQAILIRAIEPLVGLDIMERRRGMAVSKPAITAGPGSISKALGIDRTCNGHDLTGDKIWIADEGIKYPDSEIVKCPRVGIAYAQEHALLPLRFFVRGNKYVSKPNKVE
ncbi:DNA-3-methyladenine glycosylase [Pedobacter sandarakinus]|uniref:DNA-3-methyladenine glycosylase n=1 Tax=Pedobacter sandarakinus TaxID=353156 RepID=UPI0022462800|nr:DNA-3-methyladenine glycosylase [Pedobacter sandarakinus]MCX2574484.1 DNA-3-methyladenine glycosylase [Pedobacter sandarakinus]